MTRRLFQWVGAVVLSLPAILAASGRADDKAGAFTPLEPPHDRPRLVVLTDIGGDPDDRQSLIRLMLYANEFDIEGLIASASGTPGELNEKTTRPDLIREIVEAYGDVRENLARHARGYPETADLLARTRSGNSNRGEKAIGEAHDTEGSRWITSVVDRDDPRPVNIAIWGGQTDLAQALWRVRHDRGADGLAEFIAKLRIHDIADQDGIAPFLWQEFPGMFYVLDAAPPGRDKREAAFRGIYLGGDQSLTSRNWLNEHVRTGHGPLGALYPDRTWTAPNPHSALKEGDTPSWFYFRPSGLGDPRHPEWGGWGGRFQRAETTVYRDATDRVGDVTSARATVWRWRPAFQNDFQARMDWCVKPPHEANHPPTAVVNAHHGRETFHVTARPGEGVELTAAASQDPDGDELTYRWWLYREPSRYPGDASIDDHNAPQATVRVPADAAGKTLHVVLEVTDTGEPPLTAYRRILLEVQ